MITGLVLQGGGALGAFEMGVIECLLDNGVKPDIVSGVSIGAINGAVLCGCRHNDPQAALRALWADLTTLSLAPPWEALNEHMSLLGNPGLYRPRTDYLRFPRWTSLYNTGPLRRTLDEHVDFDKLRPENFAPGRSERAPRLIITATNVYSGRLAEFDSKVMPLTAAHVIASASLPPGLPATRANVPPDEGRGEQLYWDGALFDNTPLSKVIHGLREHEDTNKTMYVVNLLPSQGPLPRNIAEVLKRMNAIAFSNKTTQDLRRAEQTNAIIDFVNKLDSMGAVPESLREDPGYQLVKQYKLINIINITNMDPTGIADFSAAGIEQRRLAGYSTATETISNLRPPGPGAPEFV